MIPHLDKQSWVFYINDTRTKRIEFKLIITVAKDRLLKSTITFFPCIYAELFIFYYKIL